MRGWQNTVEVVLFAISGSDRNRDDIEPIEIETLTQTRRRVQAAGPSWVLGPEDRGNIDTIEPMPKSNRSNRDRSETIVEPMSKSKGSFVEIEAIEPRPSRTYHEAESGDTNRVQRLRSLGAASLSIIFVIDWVVVARPVHILLSKFLGKLRISVY